MNGGNEYLCYSNNLAGLQITGAKGTELDYRPGTEIFGPPEKVRAKPFIYPGNEILNQAPEF